MAKRINFEVKRGAGVIGCWIAVGDTDVALVNDKGQATLPAGANILIWHFRGNAGSTLGVVGKDLDKNTVVEIKQSTIPAGETEGAGIARFDV